MSLHYEPRVQDYQLIGDSQLLRFSERVLCKQRRKKNGNAYLGLCVSGQKIMDLLNRIREGFYPISKKIILMIGTNDLLQYSSAESMTVNMRCLIEELMKSVVRLIILTIPPIPRLAESYTHWITIRKFNNMIKNMHDGQKIFVLDAYSKFIKQEVDKSNHSDSSFSIKKKQPKDYFDHFYSSSNDYENNSCYNVETEIFTSGIVSQDVDSSEVLFSDQWESYDAQDANSGICGVGEEIEEKFFEQNFLDGKTDLIHLNFDGLNILKQTIFNYIGIPLENDAD